jgi:ribosomal protein S27E
VRALLRSGREGAMGQKKEAIEVVCPKCQHTEIIFLQAEDMPRCPVCNSRMMIRELLKEGKSY